MSDNFEKYIRENRDRFDTHEPDPEIWKNIDRKMKAKRPVNMRRILIRTAQIAAIFLLAFFISGLVHNWNGERKGAFGEMPELQDAELYYSRLVDEKLAEIRPILAGCPALEEELLVDLSELDRMYEELKLDLRANIDSEELINAIIANYQLRIEMLEDMLVELETEQDVCIPTTRDYGL